VPGRHKPSLDAIEQAQARILFQMRNQLARGWLRDIHHLGCPADRSVLDHRLEGLHLTQVELSHHGIT